MKFGLNISSVFPRHKNLPLSLFVDAAVLSEELGYDGFFVPDHYNLPRTNECIEPYTTLAYIAARTERIDLGTTVTPVPRYVPQQLAKIIAHLDHLSHGRIIPGFGAGWHPPEFHTYSPSQSYDSPGVRVAKTIEGTKLILKLWTEEKTTFKGKHYHVEDAVLEPKPIQKPHPPIWSGGSGEFMLKMTAKHFDGWIPTNWKWTNSGDTEAENYRTKIEKLKKYLEKYQRKIDFTFSILGGIEDSVELIQAYDDAGCEYYVALIGDYTPSEGYPFSFFPDQYLRLATRFAKEVMPCF